MTEAAPEPTLAEIEAQASRPESRSRAIDLAIKAFGRGVEAPLVLRLVIEGLEQDGRLRDAAALGQRVTEVAPNDPEAWIEFSRLLLRLGERAEAVDAARSALKLDAESYAVQSAATAAFMSQNAFDEAAEHAGAAARLQPLAPEPLSTLAIIHTHLSDFATARDFAQRALRLKRDLPGAEIALAKVELAENRADLAIGRLREVLARPQLRDGHRAEALTALGDALDAADKPGEAFASYAASNEVMARGARAAAASGARKAVEHAASLERYFLHANAGPWRKAAGADDPGREAARHAFLIGFPRSGTTLLENALARHPAILALEETDALVRCAGDLMADAASLDRLARLDAKSGDACRKIYWDRAREILGQPLAGKVVVDKLPIGTVALPVISKLFPSARILFARRDPRDVVLSCFRRLFGTNEVMAEFLTLESAARYYDQVMRLAELYQDKLPPRPLLIRHEDVVADFDGELARALAFLGLDWDEAVRRFSERAARSRTPSAPQLALGLNARGVGAWRRFERQMAAVLPVLEPWAAKFGYPPAEPPAANKGQDALFAPISAEIGRALARGDWAAVFAQTDKALADGFHDPALYRYRGVRAQHEGRLEAAIADFEIALADAPGDIGLLSAMGLCLARLGRGREALGRLDEGLALQPDFAPAHFNRGFALEGLGDLAAATAAYERAASLDPRHAAALGALAMLAGRRADWPQARSLADRALAIDPRQTAASLALAMAQAAEGEAAAAETRLRAMIDGPGAVGAHERAMAQSALGDVLDTMGRAGEAFAAYAAAAQGFLALHGPRFEAFGAERAGGLADRLRAAFAAMAPAAWARRPSDADEDAPAFLLGFPRSGTTLVGQALALHPGLFTLEEQDTLADSLAAFYGDDAGLDRLAGLDPAQAEMFRDHYWRRAREGGWPADGRRLVDKLPTNTLGLPIIARLFPAARILVMRRDPRDVVLSCFRRQFVINPTTIEFLSLEATARLYDSTMGLFEVFQEKLGLAVRIQSFEALVGDFEGEMRGALAFLGLEWDEAVSGFSARSGAVATPSAAQLARGLNAEGVGAWRPYRFALEPILPILAPWIERFGYSRD